MKKLLSLLALAFTLSGGVYAASFEARDATPAPLLKARDLAGVEKTLKDYRGKVVVLNFWASWCPPCLREMPSMERLRVKMKGQPVEIVAVASAESASDVKAFLSKMKLGFPILLDSDGSNTQRWKVFALPTSFLIDPQGRVRHVIAGPTEWDEGKALEIVKSMVSASRQPGPAPATPAKP